MNNQQIAKIIGFYRIHYDFHDPYHFIFDGNFIKILLEKQILNFSLKIQPIIHGKVRIYTTSCILRELQLLGHEFHLVVEEARKYRKIHCNHDLQFSVDECILEQVNKKDLNYIVCSQDIQLRRNLRNLLSIPIMYFGPDQRITMQDVQKQNLLILNQQQQKKLLPKQSQMKDIIMYKQEEAIKQKQYKKKQKLKVASQLGIQLPNKIAKGPNPLSVKKKHQSIEKINSNADIPKKKRIRKKNKPNSNQQLNQAKVN